MVCFLSTAWARRFDALPPLDLLLSFWPCSLYVNMRQHCAFFISRVDELRFWEESRGERGGLGAVRIPAILHGRTEGIEFSACLKSLLDHTLLSLMPFPYSTLILKERSQARVKDSTESIPFRDEAKTHASTSPRSIYEKN